MLLNDSKLNNFDHTLKVRTSDHTRTAVHFDNNARHKFPEDLIKGSLEVELARLHLKHVSHTRITVDVDDGHVVDIDDDDRLFG